ncbi:uncharacterized protein LOC114525645 [Dendronephthya gigantea]|uniref:uncharacterized protein LOC114525645 n=1 Tax=Dendronephthya gigantea TaxID=151771 RepID=UPI001069ECE1|nr:uncharacterized protein LOC114525645 [Dendronephthya gigantea]XP_028402846.1 uncharacterized protein LOC114525645 [Dendronephthya gigantea]
MPSERNQGIPITQCVHIFEGELRRLRSRLDTPIGIKGLSCYLYGLWTHSSNVVVYLVVSCGKELEYAEKHKLNCVGYVAKEYTEHLYDIALVQTKESLSTRRQHVIVDVSDTKKSGLLHAYGSHLYVLQRGEHVFNLERSLQVNILKNESPFRKDAPPVAEAAQINWHEIKSESRSNSGERKGQLVKEIKTPEKKLSNLDSAREREREPRRRSNIERETGSSGGNQTKGYLESKITQSLSIVRSIKHKVKSQFGVQDDDHIMIEEFVDKLVLRFGHNSENWEIELKWGESGEYFVEISSSNSAKAHSQEFHQSSFVVDEIKRLCGCETCSKQ